MANTTRDWKALCAELVDIAIAHCNPDDFAVSDRIRCAAVLLRARAALAQPEPEGVEDRIVKLEADLERERLRLAACSVVAMADTPESAAKARDMSPEYHSASLADVIRQTDALMERRAAIKPVPVSERPWEREGWCDNNGWCWGFDADDTDPFWVFDHPEACGCWTHVLPHYALPIPEPTTQENN